MDPMAKAIEALLLDVKSKCMGLALPRMPRHWHGYRLALVAKLARWVSKPEDTGGWVTR